MAKPPRRVVLGAGLGTDPPEPPRPDPRRDPPSRKESPPPSGGKALDEWLRRHEVEQRFDRLHELWTEDRKVLIDLRDELDVVKAQSSRPRVEQETTPTTDPHKGMPWWAKFILMLVGALVPVGGVGKLVLNSQEELRQGAKILVILENLQKSDTDQNIEIKTLKQHTARNDLRRETAFTWIAAALNGLGYETPRGLNAGQVDFASTKNAKKPVKAVEADGTDLEIPDPAGRVEKP
jgi:hypothetical protein